MTVNNWEHTAHEAARRAMDTLLVNWHLGLTAFGGPPVHFKIFHDKFVLKLKWINEQMYQELFGVSQALSGPASTKMLYCINLIHNGLLGAILGFFLWSLPGALGMLGLSIGASNIGDSLPRPVYALLSGLNAATVGIIALAAVELSNKAITDKLMRFLVFLVAAAGLLYNALWYFPVLMFGAGCAAIVYDYRWIHRTVRTIGRRLQRGSPISTGERHMTEQQSVLASISSLNSAVNGSRHRREIVASDVTLETHPASLSLEPGPRIIPEEYRLDFSWKVGAAVIAIFFATFLVVIVLRGTLTHPPLLYKLFANLYLAGTIIFGGGPVVIPLLREYVVAEGWVTPRDFLIGLGVAQAFPGPNFNFAVFLGGLTAVHGGYSYVAGATIAFLGIFFPGMVLVHGTMGVWGGLRSRRWVKSGVRGVNAGAVGLVFTAVYRIWQVGYIDKSFQSGRSLGDDPWWVVVTATAYVGGKYFGVEAPLAIVLGAVLGLVRYGVVVGHYYAS
ncbi:chromate transporter-domain-containing protein [Hypoxylon trugodes]|uniref:chromate transporter-domain-containing protein n=1 Tax=Hypoxylon trugodes TaxID=326681 RepID=UPI00219CC2C7|nr:chromate transporter-domain-containing protein [Hypoxylon trugodes]KAI1384068.1 chromate transporter-domain-containing protein [Hypoxylon trugodes]